MKGKTIIWGLVIVGIITIAVVFLVTNSRQKTAERLTDSMIDASTQFSQ